MTERISTVPIMNARLKRRVKNAVASPRASSFAPQILLHQRAEDVAPESRARTLAALQH